MYTISAVFLVTGETAGFYATCIQISCETHSVCSPISIWPLFMVKAAELEADHSLLSSTKIENG
jgi:hypothetical protein